MDQKSAGTKPSNQQSTPDPKSVSKGVIIYIEDDPQARRIVETILTQAGYECTVFSFSTTALAQMRLTHRLPDLILLDMVLADEDDKVEMVIEKLKGNPQTAWIPIIMITGYSMAGDKEHFLTHCKDFIEKPVTRAKLLSTVEAHILPWT